MDKLRTRRILKVELCHELAQSRDEEQQADGSRKETITRERSRKPLTTPAPALETYSAVNSVLYIFILYLSEMRQL